MFKQSHEPSDLRRSAQPMVPSTGSRSRQNLADDFSPGVCGESPPSLLKPQWLLFKSQLWMVKQKLFVHVYIYIA